MKKNSLQMERIPKKPETYGVIGICGVAGNLAARVLMDHNFNVICTDLKIRITVPFLHSEGYDTLYIYQHTLNRFYFFHYILPSKLVKNFKIVSEDN